MTIALPDIELRTTLEYLSLKYGIVLEAVPREIGLSLLDLADWINKGDFTYRI